MWTSKIIMKSFLSGSPYWQRKGMALIRMVLGMLLIYHGQEVFDEKLMQEYLSWEMFSGPYGKMMVYTGKLLELISGILMLLGLLTRIAAVLIIITFLYITFLVGAGKFWYQDQHPFLFVLLGMVFLFNGPGAWSVDRLIFSKGTNHNS